MGRRPSDCHSCALKFYWRRKRCQVSARPSNGLRGDPTRPRDLPGDHTTGTPRFPGHEPVPLGQDHHGSGCAPQETMAGSLVAAPGQQVHPATWTLLLEERITSQGC